MNKINYPQDPNELTSFKQVYYDCLDKSKTDEINKHLKNIKYKGKPLNFQKLVTLEFEDLIDLNPDIEIYSKKLNVSRTVKSKKQLKTNLKHFLTTKVISQKLPNSLCKKIILNLKLVITAG